MSFVSKTMKVTSALVIFASATSLALASHNYKGERNYKGESVVAPCPQPCMLKDGFYVGAQIGYDAYRIRSSSDVFEPIVATFNPVIAATGWVGGLFLGYGQYMSDYFYLGGEIFASESSAKADWGLGTAVGTINAQVKARGSWGLALLPGVRLNDTTLGYVRLGWNWVSLKGSISESVTPSSASATHTANGFNYGVGMETLLVDNWSVRGEFTHTRYNQFSKNNVTALNVVTLNQRWNASNNEYMLGLIYHFA